MDRYFRALPKSRGKILRLKNVVGVGVGYRYRRNAVTEEPAFIVYVEKKLAPGDISARHMVPKQINGLEADVVEIGRVRMLGSRTVRARPCRPGVSIGHHKSTAGTLGALVRDKATKQLMILSNNHILANCSCVREVRAETGDPILQPGPYDGGKQEDRIGTLYRYVPLVKNAAGYRRFKVENTVDCALAKLDRNGDVEPEIMDIGGTGEISEAGPGDRVQKSGRTTALTKGVVQSIDTTLQVEMSAGVWIWFAEQIVTNMPSQPGDSGALILKENRDVVGLLFAGSGKLTVFNRISNVIERLAIEF